MSDVIKNRQVNYKKRLDPDTINGMEERLNFMRDAIERGRVIVEGLKGNVGWEALKKTYAEKVESIEMELDNFKDLPDKQRDYLLADLKFSKQIRDTVERMEKQIEIFEEEYAQNKANLNERKSHLRATEAGQL